MSVEEYAHRLLRRVRTLVGGELYVGVIADVDDPARYRIMQVVDLHEGDLSLEDTRAFNLWTRRNDAEARSGGVFATLIGHDRPTVISLPLGETRVEPILATRAHTMTHALVLPAFKAGRTAEWSIIFRAGAFEVDETELLLLTQLANMMALVGELEITSVEVARLNERLDHSLRSVVDAQRSLMPVAPPEVDGLTFAAWYEPSEEVGGDYYDITMLEDTKVGVMIADVSGHGPAASVAMGVLRTILHTYKVSRPMNDRVIPDINRVLYDTLDGSRFVTAIFMLIDPATGWYSFANAGHHPVRIRRRDGTVEPLSGVVTPPLGVLQSLEPEGVEGVLDPGECLVLFTDGVTEAFDDQMNMFGTSRLDEVIAAATPEPREMIEAIRHAVDDFSAGQMVDDRCVVVVRCDAGK